MLKLKLSTILLYLMIMGPVIQARISWTIVLPHVTIAQATGIQIEEGKSKGSRGLPLVQESSTGIIPWSASI